MNLKGRLTLNAVCIEKEAKLAEKMKKPLVKCEKTSGIYTFFFALEVQSPLIDLVSRTLLPPYFQEIKLAEVS
jgi:hypothetical protein